MNIPARLGPVARIQGGIGVAPSLVYRPSRGLSTNSILDEANTYQIPAPWDFRQYSVVAVISDEVASAGSPPRPGRFRSCAADRSPVMRSILLALSEWSATLRSNRVPADAPCEPSPATVLAVSTRCWC
jgi:hypothetical protein